MRRLSFIIGFLLIVCSGAGELAKVKPFIEKYCTDCHGSKKQKGDTRLDNLSTVLDDVETAGYWQSVLDELNAANMPPEDEPQPTLKEMSNAIELLTFELQEAKKKLNGRSQNTVMRRLNRREYINTMESLTGIRLRQDDVPEDAGGQGFDTNGEGLFMSAYQFEKYMALAKKVLDKAIVKGERPQLFSKKEEVEKGWAASNKKMIVSHQKKIKKSKGKLKPNDRTNDYMIKNFLEAEDAKTAVVIPLSPQGKGPIAKRKQDFSFAPFHRQQEEFKPGAYKVRFKAGLRKVKEDETALMNLFWRASELQIEKQVRTEENSSAKLTVAAKPKVYEVTMNLEKPTALVFDALWGRKVSKEMNGAIWIDWVEISGPHFKSWPPFSHQQVLPKSQSQDDSYVRKALASFAYKAFRYEKPSSQFLQDLFEIYKEERQFGKPLEEAVKTPLAMILSSPQFIYMVEKKKDLLTSVKGMELANRLSYFLWSSAPDKELASLGKSGKLDDPKVLRSQIVRMVRDPRSINFAKGFVPQWLEYDRFDQIAVNPKTFPEFNDTVRQSMKGEGIHFFHTILSRNLSTLNFLDSKFVVVDDVLRAYYGLSGQHKVDGFESISVNTNSGRGGIMGQGFYLTMTGNGERTSPIIRGAVTMDVILGSPSPEPPPNVPELENAGVKNSSLREKIKLHQNQPQCHSCHKKIDPIGFGLEQFNAIGKLRSSTSKKSRKSEAFETSGQLPNGSKFRNFTEMKKLVSSAYKDKFFKAMTEELLAYALGRSIGFGDAQFVDRLMASAKKDGYRMASHIARIISSPEFIRKSE